jgi:hypothetical protein
MLTLHQDIMIDQLNVHLIYMKVKDARRIKKIISFGVFKKFEELPKRQMNNQDQ